MRPQRVDILYFAGCPNYAPARALVERVARDLRVELELHPLEVGDALAAVRLRFLGSPTVRVDGRDVEPGADERDDFAFACRIYRGRGGVSGRPDEAWIRDALEAAAGRAVFGDVLDAADEAPTRSSWQRRKRKGGCCWPRIPRSSSIRGHDWFSAAAGTATRTSRAGRVGWASLLYVCHSCFASPALAARAPRARSRPKRDVPGTSTARCRRCTARRASCTIPELTRDPARGRRESRTTASRSTTPPRTPLRVPAIAARARRRDGWHECAGACSRRRSPRAGAAAARGGRRTRRGSTRRARGAAPMWTRVPATDTRARRRRRPEARPGEKTRAARTPYGHAVLRGRADSAETLAELVKSTGGAWDDLRGCRRTRRALPAPGRPRPWTSRRSVP